MATEQLEALGSEDAKWLGEYSQVHMNVFGTPLRVMDHGEGARIWDVGLRPSSLSWPEPRMALTCTSEIPEPKAMRRL